MIEKIPAILESRLNRDPRMRVGTPNQDFWDLWQKEKDSLREKGFSIFMRDEKWFVLYPADFFNMPLKSLTVPEWVQKKLSGKWAFQLPHLMHLLKVMGERTSYHDGSDTGTGKTHVACAFCAVANLRPIVIAPLVTLTDWRAALESWNLKPIVVGNWEAFKGSHSYGHMDKGYKPWKAWKKVFPERKSPFAHDKFFRTPAEALKFLSFHSPAFSPMGLAKLANDGLDPVKAMRFVRGFVWDIPRENTLFIFDEVQKAKGENSQNTLLLQAAKGYRTLSLSATPGKDPRDFKALGYVLGLHDLNEFDRWTRDLGCSQNPFGGWHYSQKSQGMDYLGKLIYGDPIIGLPPRGGRMRIADIPGFPETMVEAVCYDSPEASKAMKPYLELQKRIDKISDEGARRSIVIAQMSAYRQAAELARLPIMAEEIEKAFDENRSVVVFLNFRESMDILEKILEHQKLMPKYRCRVFGTQSESERALAIKLFQEDKCRLILVNMQAGGAGLSLHDVTGKHARLSLISPSWDPLQFHQVLGRVHRAGGKSKSIQKIIYLAGTIEEDVCRAVAKGLQGVDSIAEAAFTEKDLTPKPFQKILESISHEES